MADDDEGLGPEIALRIELAAVTDPPVRDARLDPLPPLPPATVKENPDLLVFGEVASQLSPELDLAPGDDEQGPDPHWTEPRPQRVRFDWRFLLGQSTSKLDSSQLPAPTEVPAGFR